MSHNPHIAGSHVAPEKKTRHKTILTIIEVLLWVGAIILILTLTEAPKINALYSTIFALLFVFLGISYIRKWHSYFSFAISGLIYLSISNALFNLSVLDAILYGIGAVGVYIKRMDDFEM